MIKIGFNDLSVDEAWMLLELYESLRDKRPVDIQRTAAAIADVEWNAAAPGNAPPPPPPAATAPVAAPPAAPSTGPSGATASVAAPLAAAAGMIRDARGVPWHADHHGGTPDKPSTNDDGSWKKRRGHDKAAHAAYEAQFLGNAAVSSAGTSATAQSAPVTLSGRTPPPPPFLGAPAGTVTVQEFETLWAELCKGNRVTAALETWIVDSFGYMPTGTPFFINNHAARQELYDVLIGYRQSAAA